MSAEAAALPRTRRRAKRSTTSVRGVVPAICIAVIALVFLLALFGPLLAPYDPTLPDQAYAFVGPVAGHPLGFDSQGRDLLSRLLAGAQTAILAPTIITIVSVVLGSALGIAGAWFGGRMDTVISAAFDLVFSFPGLLLAILAAAVFGRGMTGPIVALSIAFIPFLARIVRADALRERAKDYIIAAELQGASGLSVCFRHLLPNVFPSVVAQGTLTFGYAISTFAAVSYLGLGVQAPAADWGVMVSQGQNGILSGYPMESLTSGLLIVAIVVAVNVLGERMLQEGEDS
ncbi:ABC transporter permease [Leucobacter sp. wl10]|uniref:ABC transporter permease n=1 Tax=Leucobacter sp. wl10 TaxID=2304677 RepID=UPI000E5A5CDF|nr:ABC transporter permease [Leucobacter sp. wl10]RGE17643.1 ABC transporter permease [Leucobacter sp. wl10]